MTPINDDKIQGSQNPKDDILASRPNIPAESLKTQFKMMKRAVATYPKVIITIMDEYMPFLLDSSSMVNLVWQTYFNGYFRLWLGPAEGAMAKAHNLSDSKSANGGGIPLSKYLELGIEFLGLKVSRVRSLITQNLNEVLNPEHKTRLPSIVGWNLVWLAQKNPPRSTTTLYLTTLSAQKV